VRRMLKPRDVAAIFGVELDTVLDWWQAGDLPGFRLRGRKGGPVRFWEDEILECLESWRGGKLPVHVDEPATRQRPGSDIGGGSSHALRIVRPLDG
jgi:hypothetical protein